MDREMTVLYARRAAPYYNRGYYQSAILDFAFFNCIK